MPAGRHQVPEHDGARTPRGDWTDGEGRCGGAGHVGIGIGIGGVSGDGGHPTPPGIEGVCHTTPSSPTRTSSQPHRVHERARSYSVDKLAAHAHLFYYSSQ